MDHFSLYQAFHKSGNVERSRLLSTTRKFSVIVAIVNQSHWVLNPPKWIENRLGSDFKVTSKIERRRNTVPYLCFSSVYQSFACFSCLWYCGGCVSLVLLAKEFCRCRDPLISLLITVVLIHGSSDMSEPSVRLCLCFDVSMDLCPLPSQRSCGLTSHLLLLISAQWKKFQPVLPQWQQQVYPPVQATQ